MKNFFLFVITMYCTTLMVNAQVVDYTRRNAGDQVILSPFKNGFAQIYEQDKKLYLNSEGRKIEILDNHSFRLGDTYSIREYENEIEKFPEFLPTNVLLYRVQNRYGVLSPQGRVLLEADFDAIDMQSSRKFWKLSKNGKISFFLPDHTILPFFEDIGYLDGEYFDVKKDGKWHLYSKTNKKIITKESYDGFDYCGGCGASSSYVYAQKNGKWGIIDRNETILIPFIYDHVHHFMRSDNWVNSFSKNGNPVIVNIPTQKEFSEGEIIQGLLVVAKDAKYGAYDDAAKEVIPFIYDNLEEPNANSYHGYSGNYFITEIDRKKGVITLEGREILPNEYDDIKVYDTFFVGRKKQITYLMDENANVLHQVENGDIAHVNDYFYSSGSKEVYVFKIKKRAYLGLFFAANNTYIEPEYYDINPFHSNSEDYKRNFITAKKNGLETLFDSQGNRILGNCTYIRDFYNAPDGLVSYKQNGKIGIYDLNNRKEIIPPIYDSFDIWFWGEKQYVIKANVSDQPDSSFSAFFKTYHLYSPEGKKLTNFDAEKIDKLNDQLYLLKVRNSKGYVLLDVANRQTRHLDYSHVYPVNSDRLLLVSNDNKIGKLYDIPLQKELIVKYDLNLQPETAFLENQEDKLTLVSFQKDAGIVYNKKGYGYINEKAELIVTPQYDHAFEFIGDAAIVLKSEDENIRSQRFNMGVIDRKGNYIFPMVYQLDSQDLNQVESFFVGNAVKLGKYDGNGYRYRYGLGDLATGKMLLPAVYDEMRPIAAGKYLLLGQNNKFGIADTEGKILVPVEYANILVATSIYYNRLTEKEDTNIFPLLVDDGKWRYINEDGTYLPIVGDMAQNF